MVHCARRIRGVLLATSLALLPAAAGAQIATGVINDFEDGSTQGWSINLFGGGGPMGSPPPAAIPTVIATGGPGGLGDAYLRLTAVGGGGAGGRLVAFNFSPDWAGNYVTAGINAIRMNAINLGTTDLFLRFLVEDPSVDPTAPAPPSNIAISATPVFLAAGGGWQTVEFPLFGPNGLIAVLGNATTALSNATFVRILHSPVPAPGGELNPPPPVIGSLGVDNISAVPEPSTVALFATGALGLLVASRRKSRR